ncbi:MAG: hypothetical protein KGN03_01980 [Acidobacteria bacterium]|nr:hypothetical protein [Acidobacteriota bacterium]
MNNVEQFRPRSGYLLSFWAFFTISALTYINIVDYGFSGGLTSITWGLFICSFFYLIFIHPKVIYCDEGIVLVNPMKKIILGWHEISEIDAKFTMYILHKPSGVKFHAFAAQAPGRYHIRNVHPTEIKGMNLSDSGSIKAGESPRSSSGIAIAIARTRMENFNQRSNIQGLTFSSEFNRIGATISFLLLLLAVVAQITQG